MRVRVEMIERAAHAQNVVKPYRVTIFHRGTNIAKSLYYVCGKCVMKEPDNPSGRAEQRDHDVPPDAYCHYCEKRAVPWAG